MTVSNLYLRLLLFFFRTPKDAIFIATDTNVWMHHLNEVMKIIKESANHKYIVSLPNQVLQELDRLKTNGHNPTRKASQKASQLIVSCYLLDLVSKILRLFLLFAGGAITGQK